MIREITIKQAITYEDPPDGGHLPIIDPYDGCSMDCPYCFQLNDAEWNKDILVKTNIADLINPELLNWPSDEVVYIGSRCDPYMPIESKYQLTRKCLIKLNELKIPVMITTKSDFDIIFRDIDIISNYSSDLTILLGLSNVRQFQSNDNFSTKNIEAANKLHEMGIKVWAFITPVLPGITDVPQMIELIHSDIPIYLDKLRLEKGSPPANKMLNYICQYYPQLQDIYYNIVNNGYEDYCLELLQAYKDNSRVKFVFD